MLLITGFEPFTTGLGLRLDHNPTATLAKAIGRRVEGARGEVLPVSYAETKTALLDLFEAHQPTHWIGLGYAPHRETLDIETFAVNVEHATSPDNTGETPWMRPVVEGGAPAIQTRLDMKEAIATFARHGVVANPAFHAGTFLCNQSFYLGCHATEGHGPLTMAVFIHVPPMESFAAFEDGLVGLAHAILDA
jgi:pyroglutamyl-peptidase